MTRRSLVDLPVELHFRIMEYSSLPDLEMLAAANTFFRSLVQQHVPQRMATLFNFFEIDPLQMLDVLNRTRSVVSGSAALVVLNPWSFTPNDIDIYVSATRSTLLIELLAARFEYFVDTTINTARAGYPPLSGITAIHTLKNSRHVVQVIVTLSDNAVNALFRFHSTTVMNFVSAHGVYSAYPVLTSQQRGLRNHYELSRNGQSDEAIKSCLDKYEQRGYEIMPDLSRWPEFDSHVCRSTGSCPSTKRYVDDRYAYFRRFGEPSPGVMSSKAVLASVERSVWSLVGPVSPLNDDL